MKEAGYPEHVVRSILFPAPVPGIPSLTMDWAMLLANLGQRLIGDDPVEETLALDLDIKERDIQRASEFAALESVYPSVTFVNGNSEAPEPSTNPIISYLNIPIPNSPLTLHMVLPAWHPYPLSTNLPPMYVSSNGITQSTGNSPSNAVAPYVRLHILSTVLGSPIVKNRDSGEGIGLVAAGIIEEEWEKIQTQGPPEVADVLRHLLPPLTDPPQAVEHTTNEVYDPVPIKDVPRPEGGLRVRVGDDRSDAQIRVDFERTKGKEQYQSLLNERMKLPAWKAKSDFLRAFKANRVVVCVGDTGSGKTTQVPQYILDDYLAMSVAPDAHARDRDRCSLAQLQIIVTQPRRVAAISVASRVAAERGDDSSVAYTIRGESNASRRTKLLFCTTGVVLRRLTVGNGLDGVRVIVVDEVRMLWSPINNFYIYQRLCWNQVHERSVDSDFLLLELKELLKKDKTLKVVLMSATINQKLFLDYFGGAALVTIPGRTFPVQDSCVSFNYFCQDNKFNLVFRC